MTYTFITDQNEASKAFEALQSGFARGANVFPEHTVGFQGGHKNCDVYWHKDLGIWGLFEPRAVKGRFWTCFGTENPAKHAGLNITVEINPPTSGINLRCAGAFVRDESGKTYIGHTGKVGGGRKGIGKAAFREYASDREWEVIRVSGGRSLEVAILSSLESPELVQNIRFFVQEVAEFKEIAASGLPSQRNLNGPRSAGSGTGGVKASLPSGLLGKKFDEALALVAELHRGQIRKDAPIPYISHLMAVAGIVLEANAYHPMDNLEDVAIGALLHDVIEDQGHKIDLDQIRVRFGETVQRIVSECSDAIVTREDEQKPPWRERKEKYLAKIKSKSKETLLVSCADKLHNARCILFDFDKIGDQIWDRFNAGREGTVWYYEGLAREFEKAWPGNPLLPDFQALVARMKLAAGNK